MKKEIFEKFAVAFKNESEYEEEVEQEGINVEEIDKEFED